MVNDQRISSEYQLLICVSSFGVVEGG